MMLNRIALAFLAGWSVGGPGFVSAQDPAISIQILATFDYPNGSIATYPAEINDHGDIAGGFTDSSGLQRGFVRYQNGHFSQPIVPTFPVGSYTQPSDIDNSRTICGFFSDPSDTIFHGYFLSDRTFTQFDIEGAVSTFVNTLNDSGGFAGSFDLDTGASLAFVGHDGTIDSFGVPGAFSTGATSISDSGEIIGTYRNGTETIFHGYIRDLLGNLTFPIDYPGPVGAPGTILRAANNQGWIVGSYFDPNLKEHGFLFRNAYGFLTFNFPSANGTRLTGINKAGLICGSYVESILNQRHGFIARIR
jgi:hypothetical protein